MTQAQKYTQETGKTAFKYSDYGRDHEYENWLETKADNQDAQIIGMHAALANAEKERDEYREKALELADIVSFGCVTPHQHIRAKNFIAAEREKEKLR